MESDIRKTLQLKIKQPEWKSLRDLSTKLKSIQRRAFANKYGKILDLLCVEVQIGALTALVQFYDPPLRCFTFQDFQLAPTLEEFEQILGYPLNCGKPYQYVGHYPSLATVAAFLKIDIRELASKKETKNGTEGFPRLYLEKQARHLEKNGEWSNFIDVLALIIYGIVLFPNVEDFVDFAAIDVFLAYKHRKENPAPAIVADIYHNLSLRHEKKGGVILCCLPALYKCFITHIFKGGGRVETRSNRDWAHNIAGLSEKTIFWYSREQGVNEVIYHCGSFPNVPLIGTKGCINYNPALSLRQLGYPMMAPPTEESITSFIVYDLNQNSEMLKRIGKAWDRVVRKGSELGVRNCAAKESYRRWLAERVQIIKLPFRSSVPIIEEVPVQIVSSLEEIEKLKEALAKFEEEKERLEIELTKARQEHREAQREIAQKSQSTEEANKRAKVEKECKFRTKSCLDAASEELRLRRQERDKARDDVGQWQEAWKESKIAERSAYRQLDDLKQQLKEVVGEYESRIRDEKQLNENLVLEHQAVLNEENKFAGELEGRIEQLNRIIDKYEGDIRLWTDNFVNQALQIKRMLNDASYLLRRAEGMTYPLPTPIEIYEFLEYCKDMISQMRNMASCDDRYVP